MRARFWVSFFKSGEGCGGKVFFPTTKIVGQNRYAGASRKVRGVFFRDSFWVGQTVFKYNWVQEKLFWVTQFRVPEKFIFKSNCWSGCGQHLFFGGEEHLFLPSTV